MVASSYPVPLLAALLPLIALLPRSAHAILPTAAIDIYLPDTSASNAMTLFASQSSFGAPVARFDDRHSHFTEAGSSGRSRIAGVGVVPAFPPEDDAFLCNEAEGWADYNGNGNGNGIKDRTKYVRAAMLVPRGQCSFEHKALSAQRLGASAIIVYGTLGSRYSLNYTNSTDGADDAKTRADYTRDEVLYPRDKLDYDCDFGRALLPKSAADGIDLLKMPGGYNPQNDGMLTGRSESNLCVKFDAGGDTNFANGCASQRCLLTGKNVSHHNDGDVKYEACCAWDTHIWLYRDTTIPKGTEEVTIPAVFVTMGEAAALMDVVRGANDGSGQDPVVMSIYERKRPKYNASAVLIWAFGVFVAWIASYHSSADIRKVSKAVMTHRELSRSRGNCEGGASEDRRRQEEEPQHIRGGGTSEGSARSRSRSNSPASDAGRESLEMSLPVVPERSEERTIYRSDGASGAAAVASRTVAPRHDEESLELTSAHAIGFVVMASTSLLVLFFFKIYNVVKIMYAFGCSGAFAQIIVHPGLTMLCRRLKWERPLTHMKWLSEENATREASRGECKGKCLNCLWSFFGPITPVDIAAMAISYGVGATWLWVAFTIPHPDTVAFYWLIQDVFGLCMCMLFLETIKLNAIKVGATLLIVAFFYDIFFVFVTPLLTKHGESIMVNVATSGGPPKADPSWCEKYPFTSECKGGDPLPMLFAIPRIADYQGGCSMLGLGDIVLPGLLLSFASRYDESKRLMGLVSGGSGRVPNNACPDVGGGKTASCFLCCCCRNGYFGPVMVAYAVGLLMANAAVYIMEMGQPALLYLVPCCLGTMMYMGHKAGETKDLWEGPRVIRAADRLMYGEQVESAEEGEPMEERCVLEDGMRNEEEAEMT